MSAPSLPVLKYLAVSLAAPALALLLASSLGACAQGDTCAELGDCGGNPVGAWTYAAAPCQTILDEPPREVWLFNRPATVARTLPPESYTSEWCSGFVLSSVALDMAVILPPLFYVGGNAPYSNGRLRYNADGTFDARVGRNGTYSLSFSTACMRQYGSQVSCSQLEGPILAKAMDSKLSNLKCLDGAELGSCDCQFDLSNTGRVTGVYSVQGNVLIHRALRPAPDFPSDATYCASGDSLQLTGARNTFLLNKP